MERTDTRRGRGILSSAKSPSLWLSIALLFGLLSLTGCPRQGLYNNTFYKKGVRYKIGGLNKEWRPVKITENDIAYYNNSFSAIIQINSTCREDYEDVSLLILRDHLLYGLKKKVFVRQEKKMIERRSALYSEVSAFLDGVSIKAALLVIKKNECIYDFSYITRPHNFGRGIGDFHRVIYGFRVLK